MPKNDLRAWRRYPGYSGDLVFCVEHPDHEPLNVAAPSGVAAIIVAADDWGCVWSDPVFFQHCRTVVMGVLKSVVIPDG